jgi:hypothetical protein
MENRKTITAANLMESIKQGLVPPCPRCGYCGFIEDSAMNLAGVCPECNGAGRMIRQDDEALKMTSEQVERLNRWRVQGVAATPAIYCIERRHRYLPDKWRRVGKFVAGSPWRDDRPVNDEAMREERIGYERTWRKYEARVIRPDGTILLHNA